jgi:hypothetical protein
MLLLSLMVIPAMAQTVNVTFVCNTSTNLDTLGESGVVQIRGALLGGDGMSTRDGDILPGNANISWSSASSLVLDNIGGDYWSGTFELFVGDTLTYKYWADLSAADGPGTTPGSGWEGGFTASQGLTRDTRILIVGDADTTITTQYYHPDAGLPAKVEFTPPWEVKQDSVAIYFRVNMGGVTEAGLFDPAANGPVGVRGDNVPSGGSIDWGTTKVLLAREMNSVDNGSFWSGVAYVDKDSIEVGSTQAYKFFVENNGGVDWENSIGNRTFDYTESLVANADTTLHWNYFDNRAPVGMEPVESQVSFRVSTEALETLGLFDRGVGDRIAVIGAKGWDRPDDFIELAFVPALQEWAATEPLTVIPGTDIRYKYFVVYDTSRVDTTSPNFIANLRIQQVNHDTEDSGWEEPSTTGGADRSFAFANAPSQIPMGDFGFDRQFFCSVPANAGIPHGVDVTFNVDMTAATDASQNSDPLFRPGVDSVYIQPDGSMLALSQGYTTFGARVAQLTDPDGDMVYSGTWELKDHAWYQLGFVIAYGNTTDGYQTNGGGTQVGRRYYQFIQPTVVNSDLSTEWPTEMNLPTIQWVETNLPFETPPNLTTPTSVAEAKGLTPDRFALEQNFPNPFNPETSIKYQVASPSLVKIQVYNLAGQLVQTLVDQRQNQGSYTVQWQGTNAAGQWVSSGVYFIRMEAGDFSQSRKMTLMR